MKQRDRIYQRLHEDADYPADAVIVSIGWEPHLLPPSPPGADVMWPEREQAGRSLKAGSEGPYTVPEALALADEVVRDWGFVDVVISIYRMDHWDPAWGILMPDKRAADPSSTGFNLRPGRRH